MTIDIIWQEYRQLLQRFLASKVANSKDAEDLLQDILIKVYKRLDTISEVSNVKAWLLQVANNTIIDFYRQKGRDKELSADDLWYQDQGQTEHELAQCIVPFIQCLPTQQQELLIAIEINDMSQKAVAEQQEISYSTLKSRVQKARQSLKRLFEQCCQLELDALGNAIGCKQQQSSCTKC